MDLNFEAMNVFNKIIIALTGILLWSACLPEPLDIKNVPVLAPHIVVASQVIPGQSIAVLLTNSIGALDAGSSSNPDSLLQSIVINDAIVTIRYNNITDTLLFISNGVYGNVDVPLIDGLEYYLEVNSPGIGKATSSTTMETFVPFDSVSTKLIESGKDTLASVSYSFTDPPGKNWYMVDVQKYHANNSITSNLNPRIFTKVLIDDDFNGQVEHDEFTVPFRRFSKGDTVAVIMANISEAYYIYLKETVGERTSLSDLVSDPLTLPTNVQNGFGYFNMHVQDTRVFIME